MADFTRYWERVQRLKESRERDAILRKLEGRWGSSKPPAYMRTPVQQQLHRDAQAAMQQERERREAIFDAEVLARRKLRGL